MEQICAHSSHMLIGNILILYASWSNAVLYLWVLVDSWCCFPLSLSVLTPHLLRLSTSSDCCWYALTTSTMFNVNSLQMPPPWNNDQIRKLCARPHFQHWIACGHGLSWIGFMKTQLNSLLFFFKSVIHRYYWHYIRHYNHSI